MTLEPAPTSSTWLNSTLAPCVGGELLDADNRTFLDAVLLPARGNHGIHDDDSSWTGFEGPQKSRELYGGGRKLVKYGTAARSQPLAGQAAGCSGAPRICRPDQPYLRLS